MDKTKKNIRAGSSLSWQEREAMIKEYLAGNEAKNVIWQRYTGQDKDHGQILRWMRALGYISIEKKKNSIEGKQQSLSSSEQTLNSTSMEQTDQNSETPEELQKRIEELEKQLQTAQLKNEGYELMLDTAEKQLNIPIRKKYDTR